MRVPSTPTATKNKLTVREVFIWALVFIFGSQFVFHFLIGSSLHFDEQCSPDSASDSPRCTELVLFQKWQADALAAADPDAEALERLVEHAEDVGPEDFAGEEVAVPAIESVTSLPEDGALSRLIAALAVERPDLAVWVSTSSTPLESLDAPRSETDVPQLATASVETTILTDATLASGQELGLSDWGQNLAELQESLEKKMHSLRSIKQIEDSVDTSKGTEKKATHLTAWARDLQALQHHMEEHASDLAKAKLARREVMEKNAAERKERAEKRHAGHATTHDSGTRHEGMRLETVIHNTESESEIAKPLTQRIWDLGRELCSEPERRNRPSCIQFLDSSQNESNSINIADDFLVESEKAQNTFSALRDNLPESSYDLVHSLKWPAVRNWRESGSKLRGYFPASVLTATHDALRHARWAGMIPKVACVSVIPSGQEAKYQIKYLVNNFRLQTYEGPKQLILVHDHNDKVAKHLVGKYADGVYIRSAAARSNGIFPSTTAYRFGAYVADADIIARWDFDAWHHPDRLTMQVRALAHKARPVNRLLAWTVRNGTEDTRSEPDESIGEASLVGEKVWMAEHWHPLLGDETSTLTSAHLRYLVQLDMPGLIVYSSGRKESS